ncbi:hypothetical protein P691DRAFT_794969 [Macrolepiota fuliginosa MF-IS2]|uniref:Uncharacterized protein n=1 Tax=Macrolepiota fuliginosa MF-IS2 TaxID=1400762 RepID=A0A9P5X7X3_9AGAR|nr:hypothetical protein P691DRAFT_794969 [Macrolepiota fuliginosa MF-IS2]
MASDLVPLIDSRTVVKVSSTLDKSTSKKNLTDGNIETCWTSQQGLPQFIQFNFESSVVPQHVSLVFQGGFVGTQCSIYTLLSPGSVKGWLHFVNIYPEDVNRRQAFDLQPADPDLIANGITAIKFAFNESSDFFGRIIVYDLKLEGSVAAMSS